MFSLQLLGGATVQGPGGPLTGRLAQRRRVALLAVLADARRRPISRDRLLALFWPEAESDRARHSLADSVYQVRKELGEQAIVARGDDLWLDAGVVGSDVAEFEDAVGRGDLAAAVALYRGPFLDGFHLHAAPEFEHWVDERREALARMYAGALEQSAEDAAARQDLTAAVEWWRRRSALEPLNARIALRLMAALDAAGHRAGAIQHARIHTVLLEQELAAAADPDVAAFAERLRRGNTTADPPTVDQASTARAAAVTPDEQALTSSRAAAVTPAEPAPAPPRVAAVTPGDPAPAPPQIAAVTPAGGTATAGERVERHSSRRPGAAGSILRRRPVIALSAAGVVTALALAQVLSNGTSVAGSRPGAATYRTLAVLPCANLSADPTDDYFSDGLTEELIATLSQVHDLRVAASTSAFAFKGRNRDIREIARVLDVATVVECSVRRVGQRFRVTAQLISASDGMHVWAETYQRDGADVLEIQSDLALRIAQALQAKLTPREHARLARRPTTTSDAHALYLKGRYFWNQRTLAAYGQAIEYFERAIVLDPHYAAPWAGLARAYSLQGLSGAIPPAEARQKMRAAVLRAVELDDGSPEAYAEMGAYLHIYEWDAAAAERAYLQAITLDPGYSLARHLYANMLSGLGRHVEALPQRRAAVVQDPLSPQLNASLGITLLTLGRIAEAEAALLDAVELDSMASNVHTALGELYLATGQNEKAVAAHRRAAVLSPENVSARARLARVLAWAGATVEAERILTPLRNDGERRGIFMPSVAAALAALGDADGAYDWLRKSYQQRHPGLRITGNGLQHITDERIIDLLRQIRR